MQFTNFTKMIKKELETRIGRTFSDSTFNRLKRDCKVAGVELSRENLQIISVAKNYSTRHNIPVHRTLKLFKNFEQLPKLSLDKSELISYLKIRTGAHKTTIYRWFPDDFNLSEDVSEVMFKALLYCIKNKKIDYPEREKLRLL